MNSLSLIFSPVGSIGRLSYILLSGIFSGLNIAIFAVLIVSGRLKSSFFELLYADPFALWSTFPIAGTVVAVNIYIQLCLIFKRSNNFSGSYGFGWFLAAAWFAPFIVPVLFPGEFPISTLRLAGGAVSAVMGMVLFFKADGIAKPASGQFAGPGAVQQPESTSIGTLDETTDLVARAAALRKAEEAAARNARAMQRPESSEVAVKSKSFGNRSRSFAAMR